MPTLPPGSCGRGCHAKLDVDGQEPRQQGPVRGSSGTAPLEGHQAEQCLGTCRGLAPYIHGNGTAVRFTAAPTGAHPHVYGCINVCVYIVL